ncbi:transposase [Staphylococcus simiae CCM 7213 = CCUG 51256]|uniref:Transposase n=1 Tax=Staphylococcus simiae CCM 7213 = CCUG 51256 TaxID=911238 RepID=G5JJX0_9STAP|nr:transposase [Staphylococcus simiae CCM 7213 = CCUG 51256]SNV75312.1 Transposase [Staphylococcus simiae]
MKRVSYSLETKNKVIEMKTAGYTTKEIMETLNIRNRTQVDKWWRWYRNGESYRFSQQVGKQYSYGKGIEELSEFEKLKLELKRKDVELNILKKYKELERKWFQQ